MIRVNSGDGFSLDGCRTKADVDARREFLKTAARHQQRAHRFSDDDLRALRATDADVPPFRLRGPLGSADVTRVFIPA